MRAYLVRRVVLMLPVMIGMSLIIFVILRAVPGDAIDTQLVTSGNLTPAQRLEARRALGLDKPVWQQYFIWAGGVLHGDLGRSYQSNRLVTAELRNRVPITAELALLVIAIVV